MLYLLNWGKCYYQQIDPGSETVIFSQYIMFKIHASSQVEVDLLEWKT